MYENVSTVKIKEEPMDCDDADLGVANDGQTNAPHDYMQDSGNFSSVTIKEEIIDDLDHQIVDESDDVITVNFGRGDMTELANLSEVVPFEEECPRCFRVFNAEQMYRTHVHTCTMCPVCQRPAGHQYEQHMQAHRANRFFCKELCGQHFATFVEVIEHEFHEHQMRKAVCNMCALKFTYPPDVRRHQAIVHSDLPQFCCSFCRSYFASAPVLVAHWRQCETTCGMLMKLVPASSVLQQKDASPAMEKGKHDEEVRVKEEPIEEDELWSSALATGAEEEVKTEIFEPGEYVETRLSSGGVEQKPSQFVLPPGLRIIKLPNGYKPPLEPLPAVSNSITVTPMTSTNMVSIPRSALKEEATQPKEPAVEAVTKDQRAATRQATLRKNAVAIKQIECGTKQGPTDPLYAVLTIPATAPVTEEVHEEEFRRMVVESTMKALEEASMTQANTSHEDSQARMDPQKVAEERRDSTASTDSADSGREVPISLNALPKITYKGDIILSLKSLGSSTVVSKDKLKDIVSRAADLALNEARRKHALSRENVQTLAKNGEKRKIVDSIVEQMKLAEMGVATYDMQAVIRAAKRKPPPPNLVQPINETLVALGSNADGVELLKGEPPKSLKFPMETTTDRPLKALRHEFPGYRFVWVCPECQRHYETKHPMRKHLLNYHGMEKEQLFELQVEVISMPGRFGQASLPKKQKQPAEEMKTVETPSLSQEEEKPATMLTPEVVISESGAENASPPESGATRGRKRFECTTCGRVLATRYHYQDHVRSNCSREPTYKCEVCGKAFFSAGTLNCHRSIHTGELPHKCDYCEKRFRTRGQVTVHHRIHTGERPFVCQVCSQSFTHRETLISHLARHIGMKRYKCYGCDKHFACISGLTMHRSIRPDTCGKVKFSSRAVGPRVRVIRGKVVFEPQPEINPYLRAESSTEVLSEIQNQPAASNNNNNNI